MTAWEWGLALTVLLGADDQADAVVDGPATYGEVAVLQRQYADPALRTGHDLFAPLTRGMQGYFDFKDRLREQSGLSYTIEIAPQFQWDVDGASHANNETNLIVQWAAIDASDIKRGGLLGWYQLADTLGSLNTSQFMADVGVISPLNGGDTAPGDQNRLWQMLVWEQWFANDSLRFGVGKLTTRTFLNLNRYAVSDREDFFSPMIVNNPVSPFTARNGIGVFAQKHFAGGYLTGMLREADGTRKGIGFDTLDSGKWEAAVEYGFTPGTAARNNEGYYRFTGYYTDSIGEGGNRQPPGWSVALSFDQDFGARWAGLFRYAYASEPFRTFKQRAVIGAQLKQPWRFQHDRVGLAAWWAEPTSPVLNHEAGAEAFWKLQLAPYFELTPHLQMVFDPQFDPTRDVAVIAGLRVRIVL